MIGKNLRGSAKPHKGITGEFGELIKKPLFSLCLAATIQMRMNLTILHACAKMFVINKLRTEENIHQSNLAPSTDERALVIYKKTI